MQVITDGGKPIKAWIDGVQLEAQAREQLINASKMPFIHKHMAVMPDVHWGMGATIGSVIPTIGAIIPAAVGVDIGCGMMAQRTSIRAEHLPDNMAEARSAIEAAIPHGRTDNGGPSDEGAWTDPKGNEWLSESHKKIERVAEKHPKAFGAWPIERISRHIGTLGSGNHFIELCLDEEGYLWIMLHSGSRGVGNRIGSYFISKAKQDMERWFISLPDKDLAYIPDGSQLFYDYMVALNWAQDYALENRRQMMGAATQAVEDTLGAFNLSEGAVNCHHNYVTKEHHFGKNVWLTRKGAVNARKGVLGIIPGSMGAKSFIVEGLGNPESFDSCSHGAGRTMSRRAAKDKFTVDDHAKATEGVECRKDEGVIDETPGAYKDIDAVMAAQSDLVSIRHTLKQIVCVKG